MDTATESSDRQTLQRADQTIWEVCVFIFSNIIIFSRRWNLFEMERDKIIISRRDLAGDDDSQKEPKCSFMRTDLI